MVLTSEKNIIATSSAELCCALPCSGVHWRALACSGVLWIALACIDVLWRALACSGVLWRALLCRTQVLDNEIHYPKNSSAVICVFLKLFVHDLLYKFIDSIDG